MVRNNYTLTSEEFYDTFDNYLSGVFTKSCCEIGTFRGNDVVKGHIDPSDYKKYLDNSYSGGNGISTSMSSIEGGLRLSNYIEVGNIAFEIDVFTDVAKKISLFLIDANAYYKYL